MFARDLVLDDIPVLDKNAVFDAKNVRSNTIHAQAEMRKSSVHHYDVPISDDRSWLILERRRKALDEIEPTLTTRWDERCVECSQGTNNARSLRSPVG